MDRFRTRPAYRAGDFAVTDLLPGYELDALIATKVMGWAKEKCQVGPMGTGFGYQTEYWSGTNYLCVKFCPSTDIAHAWEVVEYLRLKKIYLEIIQVDSGFMVGNAMGNGYTDDDGLVELHLYGLGLAPTSPHAICLAALKFLTTKETQWKNTHDG